MYSFSIGSSEEQIADILVGKTEGRKHLVQELLKGEALQQQMLLKLLLSQDEQRQHITKQLEAISNELALLSQAELQQKVIRMEGSLVNTFLPLSSCYELLPDTDDGTVSIEA